MFLDGELDKKIYEYKRKEFAEKRKDIVQEIENHNNADNDFSKCLITLLDLASRAGKTFKGSTIEEKRKLINLVFDNLELKGQKLAYTLYPPFDAFIETAKNGEWWA